jgi:hypothetical protein
MHGTHCTAHPQPGRYSRQFPYLFVFGLVFVSLPSRAADPNPPSFHCERGAWPICRQWNVAETRHFAKWIEHIYDVKSGGTREQRLARLERVLTDPAINLLLDPDFAGSGCNDQLDLATIRAMHNVLDCAKLTVALSSYYSYRRGLPWMASHVRASNGTDVRIADSTIPSGEMISFEYDSADRFFRDAITGTCTGNFRVELDGTNAGMSDTLPVAIARDHLLPGCMYYVDGHVLVLAKITADGQPRFLDATTAASRDIYTFNGFYAISGAAPKQAAPGREYAGCFRGYRVFRWPIAEFNEKGEVSRVRRRTDAEMAEFGYSTEQYDKLADLIAGKNVLENGTTIQSFRHFMQLRLRTSNELNPGADLRKCVSELVALLEERERRVQYAWRDVLQNGPVQFPEELSHANVFTASGRWGELATALSDSVCRAKYFELMERIDNAIAWFDVRSEDVNLDGLNKHAIWSHADLASAVLRAKNRIFGDAKFTYVNSTGQPVQLSLLDFEKRLYSLSFDPNHPPEIRWGAEPGSPEASAAPDTKTPSSRGGDIPMAEAYRRQAYYRSLTHWEPDPSDLSGMATEGFPVPTRLDEYIGGKWIDQPSPPLVPRGEKVVWVKDQLIP